VTDDAFEATFRVRTDRDTAWRRLTETAAGPDDTSRLWLPGFDSRVTVVESEPPARLRATKDDEPCAGTDIVVTLEADETGTRIRVVQSRFGDWLPARYEVMAIGWRFIHADLQTYLATGVHARRHLRAWGDLGCSFEAADGGVRIERVRAGGLADRLGMYDGDLLVSLAGAPIASLDDLVTVLRVVGSAGDPSAGWIRAGELHASRPAVHP
jgi:hypothetical protein